MTVAVMIISFFFFGRMALVMSPDCPIPKVRHFKGHEIKYKSEPTAYPVGTALPTADNDRCSVHITNTESHLGIKLVYG